VSAQPWREVPRQDGRRFVVTGASGGIGLETAKALAERGAHVVLAVRSLDRGRAAAAQMQGDVEVGRLDVADLTSVRAFAEQLGPVDVLVNNAGALALPLSTSPDGVELHLATNHLGHFALTNLLLPRLTDRVVVVGSPSHRHGRLDLDDLDWTRRRYRPYAAYADSKLANLLFMAELQRRPPASPAPPAVGSRRSSGGTASGWSGWRPGRVPCPRCTPRPWTCPGTPTSARTASAR
jgi:NAD(P)-dependent dehydrogenase (short-subunit alcohol dehydrogenase family)